MRAVQITLDDLGRPSFQLVLPAGTAPVTLRLHGAHNVANALAAAAIAAEAEDAAIRTVQRRPERIIVIDKVGPQSDRCR